jgi:hypothetical protein
LKENGVLRFLLRRLVFNIKVFKSCNFTIDVRLFLEIKRG